MASPRDILCSCDLEQPAYDQRKSHDQHRYADDRPNYGQGDEQAQNEQHKPQQHRQQASGQSQYKRHQLPQPDERRKQN